MINFDGVTCLVTGAGGEIGRAIAVKLGELGGNILVCDLDLVSGERTAAEIKEKGHKAQFYRLDVGDEENWNGAIAAAQRAGGDFSVLVNCAGLFGRGPSGIAEIPFEEWQRVHRVNLDGAFLGVRAGVAAMAGKGGSIVNIGSVVGYFGARSGVAYGVSKAAIRGLTLQASSSAIEAGTKVRVNAVHPGYVLTESALGAALKQFPTREEAIASFARRNPSNRVILPEDIAKAVAFLASDAASMINGADLMVDDGLSTQMPGKVFQ
ncbi:SDR family NAD(P)-dependent oxidoreductase [Devosia ginsengisoli]|uniref:SDR family NAD(P)-dependent oxidoreductase n=1 Tax=Devosia ginsengisoli TaxID=400770 RepID=UPI0026EE07B4|nr:SDR family oxidoreductase [Devosia ginsengisoli]MCR6671286.1 SDR family oxidoreductase [Devosia ginsengisoli]